MPSSDLLDFEEPVGVLLKEIEALRLMPQTADRLASIARLEARATELRTEIYATLAPWQRVQVARHANRPCMLDYVERLFTDFIELHGDRRFADDKAIVTGLGRFNGRPVAILGHQKGRDTKQKIYRNFGYAKPEGYRKALRVMKMAEKFALPLLVFVDTPAAYPGIESEERGVAEAIALNLREMALLDVPIVVMVCGEGGSGGALGIAIGDRVLMQEFTIYSVIPPEGCAAILWRDAKRKVEAAEALKITAPDLLAMELIDGIVKEPPGGAHNDYDAAAALVGEALARHLSELESLDQTARLDGRYRKFRLMGREGQAFINLDPATTASEPEPLDVPEPENPRTVEPRNPFVVIHRRIWQDVPADDARVAAAADSLKLPPVIARLLCQRGVDDPDAARRFLAPSLSDLHDPFLLSGMREAVDRLRAAIARRERIVIHGDYDVDGITSTIILRRAIELAGGCVDHFVPDRLRDGYGLQPAGIERLHAAGAGVIVSVDCGIRAAEAAERALELGVDLIITDHHEPDAALPRALAVINPKRADCRYPEKHLAGVGVALKLVQGLLGSEGRASQWLPHFVKIAAIGTLADVVPLVGENRVIAHHGLAGLSSGPHGAGLEALLEESGLLGKRLEAFHIGFILGPRVNAAGRMQSADLALDLLLMRGRDEDSKVRARLLARRLSEENTRRQEQEAAIVADARRVVENDLEIGAPNILVVAGDGWHRGVIGIVASKLVEAFQKPAIVLSIEDGVAHGSARSIPNFDMLGALEACSDVLLKFGGHRLAAGVTLEASRIGELRRRLAAWAGDRLTPDDLIPRLPIHAELGLRQISPAILDGLGRLGPFGPANPVPMFRTSPVQVVATPRTIKNRHLKLMFKQDGRTLSAMAWRAADRGEYLSANRDGLELAYSLGQGEYQGVRTTELVVADVRMPAGVTA